MGGSIASVYGHTGHDFIKQTEDEISRHLLPYKKQRQYTSTQIVAKCLKVYFACEAVVYRSAMTKDRFAENRNIVLLPRADDFLEKVY